MILLWYLNIKTWEIIKGDLYQHYKFMKADDNHFDVAKKDFECLKKNKQIPPQMQVKLEYLLARVEKRPIFSETTDALPQYEKNSLDQLSIETGIHLFCNIVNCLSGKEVVLYFRDEKAYIRKDEILSMWKQCFITCDSNNIVIRKKIGHKPIQIFEILNLRVSKNFKMYKKKNVFGACYNKKKNYLIGFDLQSCCARVHQLLRGLIRQKVIKTNLNTANSIEEPSQLSISRCIESNKKTEQQKNIKTEQEQQVEEQELEDVDENSDKGIVIQFIKQEEINGESMYKLLKTQENLRQMINKNYVNKFRTQIILQKPKSISSVFDYYLRMSEWNPQIQQCAVRIKLSENSFLFRLRVKKYSYMSWPRCSVLLATALVYNNNYFLVLRTTGQDSQYSDTVKMEWNQIIQICESQDKILVSIISQLDFKGYSSLEDSQRMGLKVLDNLNLFTKFYEAKEISNKGINIFNLSLEKKTRKKIMKKMISENLQMKKAQKNEQFSGLNKANSDVKIRKMSSNSEFEVPDDQSKQEASENIEQSQLKSEKQRLAFQTNNNNLQNDPQNFTIYMMKDGQSEISAQLIDLLRKKANQKYYLKQKFDQEVHLDLKKNQHKVEGPNHYIYQNGSWKVNQQQDLIFINTKVIQIQKDVIKMIIKQLGSNLMSGKSIMNMSLPVQVFDHRSILQRVAMGFGYAPQFLIPASQTEDLMEQAKFVTLFILGIGPLHLSLTKPFNPILGQTFQCSIGGIPVHLQQISHHPPISAVLIKTQNFTFHGAFHYHAQMGLNRVTGKNLTPLFIQFPKTNTFYQVKLPQMQVSGLIHGDKRYRSIGRGFIHERTNNLFVEWSIGKDKKKLYQAEGKVKPNDINGGIYTVSPGFSKKFKQCENKLKFDGLKPDDVIQTHVKITGHWCFQVFFNGTKVKSVQNPLPNKIVYPQYVLPSDSNFRLDLIYKRMENLKTSNEEKQILQNIQRHDRKLRQGKIKLK